METEIIKLNTIKNTIHSLFNNLTNKFTSKQNYDITVIVHRNENQPTENQNTDRNDVTSQKMINKDINFNNNQVLVNQDIEQSKIALSDVTNKNYPIPTDNRIIQHKISEKKPISSQLQMKKENHSQCNLLKPQIIKISTQAQTDSKFDRVIEKIELKIDQSRNTYLEDYSVKINNNEMRSSQVSHSESSEEDNDSNAGFLIENHLNQALQFMERNQIAQLQDFLYNYKEKYNFINIRTQTKWSLLMAHCKQLKLQFERASTNYNQVILNLKDAPRMITVDMGDIYNRLGLCYYETREWNKGIAAFTQALNCYKQKKKVLQYANCINNLGVLYFDAKYYIEAEKCLLIAFNIKRFEGEKKNRTNVLPILFNLLDCNLNLKNFVQSKKILKFLQEIIEETQYPCPQYQIIFNNKRAKLDFFQGDLNSMYTHCQASLNLLKDHNLQWREQFAQPYELMGLLKQQLGEYEHSKQYFLGAMRLIQKYEPINSNKIENIKKRIEKINLMLAQDSKLAFNSKKTSTHEIEEQSQRMQESSNSQLSESTNSKMNK